MNKLKEVLSLEKILDKIPKNYNETNVKLDKNGLIAPKNNYLDRVMNTPHTIIEYSHDIYNLIGEYKKLPRGLVYVMKQYQRKQRNETREMGKIDYSVNVDTGDSYLGVCFLALGAVVYKFVGNDDFGAKLFGGVTMAAGAFVLATEYHYANKNRKRKKSNIKN
jgi:hypothetical protein